MIRAGHLLCVAGLLLGVGSPGCKGATSREPEGAVTAEVGQRGEGPGGTARPPAAGSRKPARPAARRDQGPAAGTGVTDGQSEMAPARTPDGTAALPPATPEQERSLQLAKGLVLSGSCSDAVPHLEAILAGPPTVAKVAALPLLGDCYRTTGRLQETIAAYERARALLPGVAEVAAALGRAYLEAGREEDAVATLRQAIKLRPRLLQAHLDQAEALRRLGRPEEAADCQHEYERQVAEASEELRAPDVQARLLAVETLSQAREELAAMGLVTALADEDPRVRTLAATALAVSRSHLALEGLRGRLPEELAPQVLTALRQAIAAQEQAVGNPAAPPTPPSPRPTIRPTPRRRPATPPPQAGSGGDLPSRLGSPRP